MDPQEYYANQPRFNVDERVSSPTDPAVLQLRNKEYADTLAVAAENGNDPSQQSEFDRDMQELSYGEIYFKYGREVANNRTKLHDARRRLQDYDADSNTLGTDARDAAVNAATALYNGVGSLAAQGFGYVEGAIDPSTTGRTRAAEYANAHNQVVAGMSQGNLTQIAQERSYYEGIAASLDAQDRQARHEDRIAKGESPFLSKLQREGEAVLDVGKRVARTPMLATDITANAVGSLYSSAPLAGAGGAVAKGLAGAALKSQLASKVALAAGTSAGAAVPEVSGTFSEGVSSVMGMSQEELDTSPIYQELLKEGATSEEARIQLAGLVGETAAVRSLPATFALGFITNKFERMPVGSFLEGGVTRGILKIAGEGVEEAGQGVNQTIAQNTSIEAETGLERDAIEGIGEQAALGFIGGIGAAGAAATPGAARGAVRAGVGKVADQFKDREFNDPLRNAMHGGSNASRAAAAAASIFGDVTDAASPVVQKVKQVSGPVVEATKEKLAPISDAISERFDQSGTEQKRETSKQLRLVEIASNKDTETPDGLSGTILERDDDRIPESLKDVSSPEQTPVQNTVATLQKMTSKGYKPTDDEILYATNQLSRLKADLPNLPKKTRKEVARLLDNKQIRSMIAKGVSVDLNETYNDDTEITEDVITTTLNVVRVNPVNTNPVVARKILNMSDKDFTEDMRKQIEIAAKLAETLNLRTDNYHAGAKGTEKVSRQIQETGIKAADGTALRSLNQFASDIMIGITNGGNFVTEEGAKVPVEKLVTQLGNLVQHMNNKMGAVNQSIANADGNSVQFRTLKKGETWAEPGEAGAAAITIHTGSEASMNLARNIEADTKAATEVYNILREAYPEYFKGEAIQAITLGSKSVAPVQETTPEAVTEPDTTQETEVVDGVEITQEEADQLRTENLEEAINTRVQEMQEKKLYQNLTSEQIGPQIEFARDLLKKTQERYSKNPTEKNERLLITHTADLRTLEALQSTDEAPTAVEEEFVAPATDSTETKAEEDTLSEDDRKLKDKLDDSASWPEGDQSFIQLLGPMARRKLRKHLSKIMGEANMKLVSHIQIFPDSVAPGEMGFGFEDGTLYINSNLFNQDGSLTVKGEVVAVHEAAHIRDFLNQEDIGNVMISAQRMFYEGGKIYDEMKALLDSGTMGAYVTARLEYAFSYINEGIPEQTALELFAVATELYYNVNSDQIADSLKETFALMEATYGKKTSTIGSVQELAKTPSEPQSSGQDARTTDREEGSEGEVTPSFNARLGKRFKEIFSEKPEGSLMQNLQGLLDFIRGAPEQVNPYYAEQVAGLVPGIVEELNKRLQTRKGTFKNMSLQEAMKLGVTDDLGLYKPLLIADAETMTYDQNLIELAAIAAVDWLTSVTPSDPRLEEQTLKRLGLTKNDITKEKAEAIRTGIDPEVETLKLSNMIKRLWGVEDVENISLIDSLGVTGGLAKEIFTVLAEGFQDAEGNNTPFLIFDEIQKNELDWDGTPKVDPNTGANITTKFPVMVMQETHRLFQKSLKNSQEGNQAQTGTELVHGEKLRPHYEVGEKTIPSATKNRRTDTPYSQKEMDAVSNMDNTPHFKSNNRQTVITWLSANSRVLFHLLGGRDDADSITNEVLKVSVEGKNTSIWMNIGEVGEAYELIQDEETGIYYQHEIMSNGRVGARGPNYQNNKLLRGAVSPTWATYDLNKKSDMNKYWLAVAQGVGLAKLEKGNHRQILRTVKKDFEAQYGEAKNMMKEVLKGKEMDPAAFEALFPKGLDEAKLFAIEAVASLEIAQETRGVNTIRSNLSAEIDGLTNGAANMMVNMGQGEITPEDYANLQRIGFFLGGKFNSVNDIFKAGSEKWDDLYETVSKQSYAELLKKIRDNKDPFEAQRYQAIQRFASYFGNFKQTYDEALGRAIYEMTRDTAKNPMTKVNYGAAAKAVADGIADDMMVKFYQMIHDHGWEAVSTAYPEMGDDLGILFGHNKPMKAEDIFSRSQQLRFKNATLETVGSILTDMTKQVVGDKITSLNDVMVFATNIQNEYIKLKYEEMMLERAELHAKTKDHLGDKNPLRNKQGKAILNKLPVREHRSILRELSALAPVLISNDQTLELGSFENQRQESLKLSSTLDEKLHNRSILRSPADIGVNYIPYGVIGTGDALMMLEIFSPASAPKDAMDVFDGFDVPAAKLGEYAQIANAAVLKTWDQDVIGMGVWNFKSFLNNVGKDPLLEKAYGIVANKKVSEKVASEVQLIENILPILEERHKQNQARKAVFKRIPVVVDQMGGSGKGFRRRKGTMNLANINREIQKELNQKPKVTEAESYTELKEGTVASVISVLSSNLRGDARQVLEIIRNRLDPNTKVVLGSLDQLNEYRAQFIDDGQVIDAAGVYDANTDTIYIAKKDPEAMLHELVHAATFEAIFAHYNGQEDPAVERLEALMKEFLDLKLPHLSVMRMRDSINLHLSDQSPNGKASALNEFMAYTLANADVRQVAKDTRTKTIAHLAHKVIALLRKIMGNVPRDMWSNVFANTALLRDIPRQNNLPDDDGASIDPEGPIEPEDDGGNDGNGDVPNDDDGGDSGDGGNTPPPAEPSGLTPIFDDQFNYWIDLLKKKYQEAQLDPSLHRELRTDFPKSRQALMTLMNAGFSFNDREARVFRAIHAVMSVEAQLEPRSLLALQRAFEHIQANLAPSHFGTGTYADDLYQAAMDAMGGTTNVKDVSDAIAVLLAASQTNKAFRNALAAMDAPDNLRPGAATLSEHLQTVAAFLMQKTIGHASDGKAPQAVLDDLAATIIQHDKEREYAILRRITSTLNRGDNFVSGLLKKAAEMNDARHARMSRRNRGELTKGISAASNLATSLLDSDRAEEVGRATKNFIHLGVDLSGMFTFVSEFVDEIIGADAVNAPFLALLDLTNDAVSGVRQAFREHLPVVLQDRFNTHPVAEQWKHMFHSLAKTDFAATFGHLSLDSMTRLLGEQEYRDRKISEIEDVIDSEWTPEQAQQVKDKAKQLAVYMTTGAPGKLLLKNAYAIAKVMLGENGNPRDTQVKTIDELVSIYALDMMDPTAREETFNLFQNEPEGVRGLVAYLNALTHNEKMKISSPEAKINGFKGYIPNLGRDNSNIKIAKDSDEAMLKEKGYIKLRSYRGDSVTLVPYSYYITNVRQQGQYNQGIMQNIQRTYMGVDAIEGYTVDGSTSGNLSGDYSDYVLDQMNDPDYVVDSEEGLIPVLDANGKVNFFERSVSKDIQDGWLNRDENLALMIGAWAGRQAEEKAATQFNYALVDGLKKVWDERRGEEEGMFVNLADKRLKDKIHKESYMLIPQEIKDYADQVFGGKFMVREDMINLSVGYRIPSVTDWWSGKTRLPDPVRKAAVVGVRAVLGNKGYRLLSRSEEATQGVVSTAKDIIVVRSLIVPAANAQANILQLANRGVPLKMIARGTREKLAEAERYNENVVAIQKIDFDIILAGNNVNKIKLLERKKKSIQDLNKRMSIAPMIEAGQYKNLSEGLTEMDVAITSGKIGDYIEKQVDKLPKGLKTAVDVGLISKSTKIYKVANRAVQYGDFIAKSIYYDHLISQGLSKEEALTKINQEFVNFSVPPGRARDGMESLGVSWFLSFKIRIAKIAMNMMREQPVRTMVAQGVIGVEDSPFDDNLFSVLADDRLGYALGWDMLFGSPELIPWVQLMDG